MTLIVRRRDSLLTTSSGYTNYRGILNLVIILLVLSNARSALENVIKYGILVDPLSWFLFLIEGSKHWPALFIIVCLAGHILISFAVEKFIAASQYSSCFAGGAGKQQNNKSHQFKVPTLIVNATIILNLIACLLIPPITVWSTNTHPVSTSGALMIVSIVFLKLVSYHMMNYWCRDLRLPESARSRTSNSFLISYRPPAIEFTANNNQQQQQQQQQSPIVTAPPSLKQRQETLKESPPSPKGAEARKRQLNNGNNSAKVNGNHNNCEIICKTNDSHNDKRDKSPTQTNQLAHAGHVKAVTMKILKKYPSNITFHDICMFMVYPTLNYELEFARTERIRKRFLIKRLIELVILSQLDLALIQQWIVPTVSNSVLPFRQMQFSHMLERLLKLAIPNHVIWLIWFYFFFHSLLNIVAEFTRFADREFYRDWWNSESVYYFWSNWNLPVHKWCTRHLYHPLISLGLSKCQASTAVFFVSAFFHEYLVSVPLKLFRMWAFTGMLMQLPWARFVSAHFNNHFANVAVWVSLIIGQPLCILMYYHDYYVINNVRTMPAR